MATQIMNEIQRAKLSAKVAMKAALVMAQNGVKDAALIEDAKLKLEDYRRALELGKAMISNLKANGLD